MQHFFVKFGDP